MKKILIIILAFVLTIFLYSPGYFLGAWFLSAFCKVFSQVTSCTISSDPYNLSLFEGIFIALGVFTLWTIVFYIFYKDHKKMNNKLDNGKKIKSFRLI